jgi:hypothetical protein
MADGTTANEGSNELMQITTMDNFLGALGVRSALFVVKYNGKSYLTYRMAGNRIATLFASILTPNF